MQGPPSEKSLAELIAERLEVIDTELAALRKQCTEAIATAKAAHRAASEAAKAGQKPATLPAHSHPEYLSTLPKHTHSEYLTAIPKHKHAEYEGLKETIAKLEKLLTHLKQMHTFDIVGGLTKDGMHRRGYRRQKSEEEEVKG